MSRMTTNLLNKKEKNKNMMENIIFSEFLTNKWNKKIV